jgi:hypothetical protein
VVPAISRVIGSEWLHLTPVRVGKIPSGQGTPDCYVTIVDGDRPSLRVDVYAYGPDCFAFTDAIIWRDNLIIGFGSHVHAIALADRSSVTVALGDYYGHFYPTPSYLLVASGTRLFRMEPDRSILWATEPIAIDGVVIHDAGPPVVRGEAEQDPPGGWEPFTISAADGRAITTTSASIPTRRGDVG